MSRDRRAECSCEASRTGLCYVSLSAPRPLAQTGLVQMGCVALERSVTSTVTIQGLGRNKLGNSTMRLAIPALAAAALMAGAPAAFAQQMSSDPASAPAGTYHLDPKHASVTLKLSHMGLSYYTMRFDKIDASYTYDPANPGGLADQRLHRSGFGRHRRSRLQFGDRRPVLRRRPLSHHHLRLHRRAPRAAAARAKWSAI